MATLVTGATGYIGSHITKKLVDRGEKVKVLLRKTSRTENIENLDVERVYGDVQDINSIKEALKGCDTLYHTAGYVSFRKADYQRLMDINVGGTVNVLEAALEAGIKKTLYTSSVAAIGPDPGGIMVTEETPYTIEHLGVQYNNTKHQAEIEALKFHEKGLNITILNPSVVIGPGDIYLSSSAFVLWYCQRKFPGYMRGTINIVDVDDVAEGHILAAEKGQSGERYILGNSNFSIIELFKLLEKTTGVPRPKLKIPYIMALSTGYLVERVLGMQFPNFSSMDVDSVKLSKYCWLADSSKAIKELGYPQSDIEQTISKTVAWFKENGHLKK